MQYDYAVCCLVVVISQLTSIDSSCRSHFQLKFRYVCKVVELYAE